jgi:hypothetical protein
MGFRLVPIEGRHCGERSGVRDEVCEEVDDDRGEGVASGRQRDRGQPMGDANRPGAISRCASATTLPSVMDTIAIAAIAVRNLSGRPVEDLGGAR